jgi:hypothetical protein
MGHMPSFQSKEAQPFRGHPEKEEEAESGDD